MLDCVLHIRAEDMDELATHLHTIFKKVNSLGENEVDFPFKPKLGDDIFLEIDSIDQEDCYVD